MRSMARQRTRNSVFLTFIWTERKRKQSVQLFNNKVEIFLHKVGPIFFIFVTEHLMRVFLLLFFFFCCCCCFFVCFFLWGGGGVKLLKLGVSGIQIGGMGIY